MTSIDFETYQVFEYIIYEKFAKQAAMVGWLRCSTHIYKILCSNLGIIIRGTTFGKSLTAKLSRMIHSYRTNASSVSTLDEWDADTLICKKKKTVETGCM